MAKNEKLTNEERENIVKAALEACASYMHSILDYVGAKSMSGNIDVAGINYTLNIKRNEKTDIEEEPT